jgi:aspartokinase
LAKYKNEVCRFLQFEKTLEIREDLVALSFAIYKRLVETAGVLFQILLNFAGQSIKILEIISMDLEMTFIVKEDDAVIGYRAIQRLIITS